MTHLQAGDPAPDFTARDHTGKTHRLSDYAGKTLVIYFYPTDGSETCTKEACAFRDGRSKLEANNIAVLGVSPEPLKKHQRFADKYQLNFPLLVDEDKTIINAYGVWGLKKFMGREFETVHRETFIVGPDGRIKEVILKVTSARAVEQVLDLLA